MQPIVTPPPPSRAAVPPTRTPPQTAPFAAPRLAPTAAQPVNPNLVLYAVEGWGKTTFAAHAPEPVLFMARGEHGYQTLLNSGLVPSIPSVPVETWTELIGWLDALAVDPQGRRTVALDALGGFERLCHEHVCNRDFKGDWGEHGFSSFQRGYEVAVADWLGLLQRLDRLRSQGMTIVLLGHARVKGFKNPLGVDFDRYECDVHSKTWGATARWADAVLFGNFFSVVAGGKVADARRAGQKGKGIGGAERVVYAERRDGFDAKNRFGMLAEFALPVERDAAWATIMGQIIK